MAIHDMGINAADGSGLVCDCGTMCGDLAAWHQHTVRTFNDPDEVAVRLRGQRVHGVVVVAPGTAAEITTCVKTGCSAHGNGRECWTVVMTTTVDHGHVFGLPSEQVALDLVTRGGVVSMTYLYSTC